MPFHPDSFEGVYKRGLAWGEADILRDEMTFRFREELFTFPIIDVYGIATFNGYFYEAKIRKLRELAALKH